MILLGEIPNTEFTYVYVLLTNNGVVNEHYVGISNDINRRMREHKNYWKNLKEKWRKGPFPRHIAEVIEQLYLEYYRNVGISLANVERNPVSLRSVLRRNNIEW